MSGAGLPLRLWCGLDCYCRELPEPSLPQRFEACFACACFRPPALSWAQQGKLDISWLSQIPGPSYSLSVCSSSRRLLGAVSWGTSQEVGEQKGTEGLGWGWGTARVVRATVSTPACALLCRLTMKG